MNVFQWDVMRVAHAELLQNHFFRRQNPVLCAWSQAIYEKQKLTEFYNSILKKSNPLIVFFFNKIHNCSNHLINSTT